MGSAEDQGTLYHEVSSHAIKKMFLRDRSVEQKNIETTLIGQFLYPKFGPGQMWETVADRIREMGGELIESYRRRSDLRK